MRTSQALAPLTTRMMVFTYLLIFRRHCRIEAPAFCYGFVRGCGGEEIGRYLAVLNRCKTDEMQ